MSITLSSNKSSFLEAYAWLQKRLGSSTEDARQLLAALPGNSQNEAQTIFSDTTLDAQKKRIFIGRLYNRLSFPLDNDTSDIVFSFLTPEEVCRSSATSTLFFEIKKSVFRIDPNLAMLKPAQVRTIDPQLVARLPLKQLQHLKKPKREEDEDLSISEREALKHKDFKDLHLRVRQVVLPERIQCLVDREAIQCLEPSQIRHLTPYQIANAANIPSWTGSTEIDTFVRALTTQEQVQAFFTHCGYRYAEAFCYLPPKHAKYLTNEQVYQLFNSINLSYCRPIVECLSEAQLNLVPESGVPFLRRAQLAKLKEKVQIRGIPYRFVVALEPEQVPFVKEEQVSFIHPNSIPLLPPYMVRYLGKNTYPATVNLTDMVIEFGDGTQQFGSDPNYFPLREALQRHKLSNLIYRLHRSFFYCLLGQVTPPRQCERISFSDFVQQQYNALTIDQVRHLYADQACMLIKEEQLRNLYPWQIHKLTKKEQLDVFDDSLLSGEQLRIKYPDTSAAMFFFTGLFMWAVRILAYISGFYLLGLCSGWGKNACNKMGELSSRITAGWKMWTDPS